MLTDYKSQYYLGKYDLVRAKDRRSRKRLIIYTCPYCQQTVYSYSSSAQIICGNYNCSNAVMKWLY